MLVFGEINIWISYAFLKRNHSKVHSKAVKHLQQCGGKNGMFCKTLEVRNRILSQSQILVVINAGWGRNPSFMSTSSPTLRKMRIATPHFRATRLYRIWSLGSTILLMKNQPQLMRSFLHQKTGHINCFIRPAKNIRPTILRLESCNDHGLRCLDIS